MIDEYLEGYKDRADILGAYYLTISPFVYRKSFKEFSDLEFYNIVMQIMCFILENSLRNNQCFKDNIVEFVTELNDTIYKKQNVNINDLVIYVLDRLRNQGQSFLFEYYNEETKKKDTKNIKLIESKLVDIDGTGKPKNQFSLTMEGYNLLLSTKECGDLLKLQTRQLVAKLRLEKEDFVGTKGDLIDINDMLIMQSKKIDGFTKRIFEDSKYEKDEYRKIMESSFENLQSEIEKFKELEVMVWNAIEERREHLKIDFDEDNQKKLNKALMELNAVSKMCTTVKQSANGLLGKLQKLRKEYDKAIENNLKVGLNNRFSFKTEILDKVNNDVSKLANLTGLYSILLKNRKIDLFNFNMPYMEQEVKKEKVEKEIEFNEEFEEDNKLELYIEKVNEIYLLFFKELYMYGINKSEFTLKEFLKNLMNCNKETYLKVTSDVNIIRNVFMYFSENHSKTIKVSEIKQELKLIPQSKDLTINITLITGELINLYKEIKLLFNSFEIKELSEKMTINTEINLETLSCRKLNTPNFKFKFN